MICSYAGAGQVSAGLDIGNERVVADLTVLHYLGSPKKWSVYTRNQAVSRHHDKTIGYATVSSFAYHFKPGVGVSVNLIGKTNRFYSTLGIYYEKKIRHFSLYFLSMYALNSGSFNENFISVVYKHPFNKKVKLVSQNEFYNSLQSWSHHLSYERLKLGIELNKTQLGFFNETFQSGEKFNLSLVNHGLYLKQNF
jgi:hypothetical protein